MKLRYYLPRADLRRHLSFYYILESSGGVVTPLRAELANVRMLIEGRAEALWPCGRVEYGQGCIIAGPTTRSYAIRAPVPLKVFGAGVLPRGWHEMFGVGAVDVADRYEDLEAMSGPLTARTLERMRNAAGDGAMVAAADDMFGAILARRQGVIRSYPEAIEHWLVYSQTLDLNELLAAADVSRRTLDRLAKQFFGDSPKGLQRKYRALHAATQISFGGAADWLDPGGAGFYDQSHFIKEFKTFLGVTPTEYARNQASLSAQSIRYKSRAAHRRDRVVLP